MTTQAQQISNRLPEGYTLVNEVSHKSSYYFTITNPAGLELIARISDHDAMCANSKANLQVLREGYPAIVTLDSDLLYFENDPSKEDAAKQLTEMFGIEISEDDVYEADDCNLKLQISDWKKEESLIAAYIAAKITEVNYTKVY